MFISEEFFNISIPVQVNLTTKNQYILASWEANINSTLNVGVVEKKIIVQIVDIFLESENDITENNVEESMNLEDFSPLFNYCKNTINLALEKGIFLPHVDKVDFINPNVRLENGWVEISLDFAVI